MPRYVFPPVIWFTKTVPLLLLWPLWSKYFNKLLTLDTFTDGEKENTKNKFKVQCANFGLT